MNLQSLCERLLAATRELEAAVSRSGFDAEAWHALLDQRETLLRQISERMAAGEELTAELRTRYLAEVEAVNGKLLAQMEARRNAVHGQLVNLQRAKQARRQYVDAAPNGYGAFFDQRK